MKFETNRTSGNTVQLILDPDIKKTIDTNMSMSVVDTKGKLIVVVSAHSLHQYFAPNSNYLDWLEWHIEKGNLALMTDYLVNPECHHFFTSDGARKLANQEASTKTQGMLDWLDQLDTQIAPAMLSVTASELRYGELGKIH